VGIPDQVWSQSATAAAKTALDGARRHNVQVVFSRVEFDPDYLDVSGANAVFAPYKDGNLLPPGASQIIDDLSPREYEAVVRKNRFSPSAGSNLRAVLRSQSIGHIVLSGVSTSGVVLAAFTEAENIDMTMTVLIDACADPDAQLHDTLGTRLFPRSADVTTAAAWVTSLDGEMAA
jgi:nicotinamidase-related amidase